METLLDNCELRALHRAVKQKKQQQLQLEREKLEMQMELKRAELQAEIGLKNFKATTQVGEQGMNVRSVV